jgi:hypothetical protein
MYPKVTWFISTHNIFELEHILAIAYNIHVAIVAY